MCLETSHFETLNHVMKWLKKKKDIVAIVSLNVGMDSTHFVK